MKKQKLLFIIISLSLFGTSLFAQDIIVKKDGQEIESKVTEIGTDEIKYKKYSNLEGPIYSINKDELVFIKFKNGEKEVFTLKNTPKSNNKELSIGMGFKKKYYEGTNSITKQEFKRLFSTNEKAYNQYKTGKMFFIMGMIVAYPSAFLVGWELGAQSDSDMLIAGIIGTVTGYGILLVGNFQARDALKTYNKSVNVSFNYSLGPNGVGFAINF